MSGAGSERRLTARLARFFAAPVGEPSGPSPLVDLGDDAAVVPRPPGAVVLCCDPVVAGVHFTAADAPALVGRKVVNRNLSDLAAMGALPDWLLLSLVLPRGTAAGWRDALLGGVRRAARAAGCRVVGGDVAVAPVRAPAVITVTAVGHLAGRRALVRSAARAGDRLFVTGPLGGSRAGHHLRFRPALGEGAWLARQRGIGAVIDVSDGLALDLSTVLHESRGAGGVLGAELDAAAIPIRAAALRLAGGDRDRALRAALGDGEDHVLLFSARRALPAGGPLRTRARRPIGRIVARPGLWLVHRDGRRERLPATGFEHALGG